MTRQLAGKKDTEVPVDLDDLKYTRVGYTDQDRRSDHLLASVLKQLPGNGRLPLRWHYRSHGWFLKKYGQLGSILWAGAGNSHLLMINGFHIARVWTDTSTHCQVDISDALAGYLAGTTLAAHITSVPSGNIRKCKPLTKRVKVWQQFQVNILVEGISKIYGICSTPV